MPLNKPALSVPSVPHSVQQARRWVLDAIADIGRTELADTAELGVSELVTNAVLHATDPITVRVRGTQEHPRVEVRDGSTEPPVMPLTPSDTVEPPGEDELLLTFGRGLDIVARCADAWGAEIEENGKVMWFAPASTPAATRACPGSVTGLPEPVERPSRDTVLVKLLGAPDPRPRRVRGPLPRAAPRGTAAGARPRGQVPPRQVARRPVRVVAARGAGRPGRRAAAPGPAGGARVGRPRGAGLARRRPRRWAGSWSCSTSPTSSAVSSSCSALARTPRQVRFQTWFFTEFARQGSGRSARPWAAVARPGACAQA